MIQLPRTLSAAIPAFNALNAAFPPLRELAVTLLPGVKSTGPTIDARLPFITQLRLLVQPSELQGLTEDLRPTVPALAQLTNETIPLMRNEVRPASSCVANVIIPWSQLTVPDSHFNASNGFPPRKVYVEAVDYLPGLAGESRNFDANGPYIRVLGAGGTLTYSLQPGLFGQSLAPLDAVQPQLPPGGKRPPYEPNVPCETQPAINEPVGARRAAPIQPGQHDDRCRRCRSPQRKRPSDQAGAQGRCDPRPQADRSQGPLPEAGCLSDEARDQDPRRPTSPRSSCCWSCRVVVAGYILNHERFRFPFIQSSPFTINAEFSTAQAVTPGQGQSVRVSGVQIGEVGGVTLKNGIADRPDADRPQVQAPDPHQLDRAAAAQDRAQGHVHRARTRAPAPRRSPSPASRSRSPTPTPTSTSTRSSPRSTPTRAATCSCWSTAPAQGLAGNGGSELAQVLERFEPTHRDLARRQRGGRRPRRAICASWSTRCSG